MKSGTRCLLFILLIGGYSCNITAQSNGSGYADSLHQWLVSRDEQLRSALSPLNLIGIFPLREGINSFGSSDTNKIFIPMSKIPEYAGSFILKKDTVYFTLDKSSGITSNIPISPDNIIRMYPSDITAYLYYGSLRWFITGSGNKYAVRLLDTLSDYQLAFKGVKRFDVDENYKFPGKFSSYESAYTRAIPNVLGKSDERTLAGKVSFVYNGRKYELEAFDAGKNLFISFSDLTSQDQSYAFRFLHIPKPGIDGFLTVDFNKATNPNCAFSPYAPCPLPPPGNVIDFAIPAGEKKYSN